MAFNGSLITLGSTNFPLGYVYKESYKVSKKVQDLDSTRNANGVLQRNVLDHTASVISFSTKPMWNTDLANMMALIRNNYLIAKEKKVSLTYYQPETDSYETGTFYLPDIEFPIQRVDLEQNKIFYGSFTLEFIEY